MSEEQAVRHRSETDTSLLAERDNTDRELARRVVSANVEADEVLAIARARADRLLQAARVAADARLPLNEQTQAAVDLLLEERTTEDQVVAAEREEADDLLRRERAELRERLMAQLVLEREATDLCLAAERHVSDFALAAREGLLAQASHDLRALMAALKIHVSLLAKQTHEGGWTSSVSAHLAAILTIEAQMDRLISDLVDIAAIEAGGLRIAPRSHEASELITMAAAVYEPLAREREQVLSLAPRTNVGIQVDLPRGVQVLGNLLANAIRFTPRGGRIHVGCEVSDHEVAYFVADTGPGVLPDQTEKVFERFFRSSTSPGLGLGLFIASRIVAAHGGRIWLDRNDGPGAVFRFTLPRV